MKRAVLSSTGRYLPEKSILNEALDQFPQSALGLIAQKTGVESRCHAAEDECTSDLALKAALNCLDKISFPPEEIEVVILSTSSPDRMQPATATRVQHQLGAENAFAFDINSVCSGSTFGISLSDALIRSGQYENVLFVASEVYSKILNEKDFSTFPYFGDGAGAILFQAGSNGRGVIRSNLKTDGSKNSVICVPGGGTMLPFSKMPSAKSAHFKMNGKVVFEFATAKGAEIIRQLLEDSDVLIKDVKSFVCHQANINILKEIARQLDAPIECFPMNLNRYGNTASASVLISLDETLDSGMLSEGDLAVTAAYGGGLSWGANLIRI